MVRGQRLRRAFLAAAVVLLWRCEGSKVQLPDVQLPVGPRPASRQIRATVLTVKTNLIPEKKAFLHLVVIADGKARIGSEIDQWRLFDLRQNTVTFVDELSKSYRTESFASLVRQKRALLRRDLPEYIPDVEFASTQHQRTFGEFPARLSLIRYGGYQRSLWMSNPVAKVPDNLFPLIVASESLTTPYSPAMSAAFEGMLRLRGFPVIDRSDVTYGGQARIIEKKLERVEERQVPAEWLELPADYRDLTPKP